MPRRALALLALPLLPACEPEGCLSGSDAECTVPSPCTALAFTCDAGTSEVGVITSAEQVPGGTAALGALGDYRLANDKVVAIIDALDHPHYIAPTGGGLLDLSIRGKDNESFRHLFQATGLLPDEAANFTEARIIEEGDVKAVQFRGTSYGHPSIHITTRYEIRPCEPGIRVRTEIVNLEADPHTLWLADAHYFGDRELLPFMPSAGMGHDYPSFGLSTVKDAFRDVPYMVAADRIAPATTYATVSCVDETLTGFASKEVTALGLPNRIVMPRDYLVFERFIGAAEGSAVSNGVDLALELREQLWGEGFTELSGALAVDQAFIGDGVQANVLVSEGTPSTPAEERVPITHVYPNDDGTFRVRVPKGRSYVLEVEAFGRAVAEAAVDVGDAPADVGTLDLPAVGELTVNATVDGLDDHALVFFRPSDDATLSAVKGQFVGKFEECAPLLGHPIGASPACNRLLVDGETTLTVPPGTYDLFATAGLYTTMAHLGGVVVAPGTGQSVVLEMETIEGLQPEGTLSADFHVHGAASFDSMFPNDDRMRSFLAARVDVLVSTEHDVVYDYAKEQAEIDPEGRLEILIGTETTGHALKRYVPGNTNPKTIGHWIFWPVPYDPVGPYRGSAWDEFVQPGELFTRMEDAGWDPEDGVAQLNHPWGGAQLGRDYGWAEAMELDLTEPIPREDDGSAQATFIRRPEGARFGNADYDIQEVMNSTDNANLLPYRAVWFHVLNEGFLRAGTANSDSHHLAGSVLGTPHTLVYTDEVVGDFDAAAFNAAVRDGRMIGGNGPLVVVRTTDREGAVRGPSLTPFTPAADATLDLSVTAAPWVPVDEVRIVVNGEVVKKLTDLAHPADPFGAGGAERLTASIPLSELLPPSGDAWVIVEAGVPLVPHADLDCNGVPDTGDHNGDGTIDWRDVAELTEDPGTDCLEEIGGILEPAAETDRSAPMYVYQSVVPGGYPTGFANPLVFDRDGDGYDGVPR